MMVFIRKKQLVKTIMFILEYNKSYENIITQPR